MFQNLEEQVHTFSRWKQLGLYYLIKFSSAFLPTSVADSLVLKKLGDLYPLHLTLVDTNSTFPHLTFWGQPVQEFTFWRPPQSNMCKFLMEYFTYQSMVINDFILPFFHRHLNHFNKIRRKFPTECVVSHEIRGCLYFSKISAISQPNCGSCWIGPWENPVLQEILAPLFKCF